MKVKENYCENCGHKAAPDHESGPCPVCGLFLPGFDWEDIEEDEEEEEEDEDEDEGRQETPWLQDCPGCGAPWFAGALCPACLNIH